MNNLLQYRLNRLRQAVWAPGDLRFFLAALHRLKDLIAINSSIENALGMNSNEVDEVIQFLTNDHANSLYYTLTLSPVQAHFRRQHQVSHPLAGMLTYLQTYAVLITTKNTNSPEISIHNEICAHVLAITINENLKCSSDMYEESIDALTQFELTGNLPEPHQLEPLCVRLRPISLKIRELVDLPIPVDWPRCGSLEAIKLWIKQLSKSPSPSEVALKRISNFLISPIVFKKPYSSGVAGRSQPSQKASSSARKKTNTGSFGTYLDIEVKLYRDKPNNFDVDAEGSEQYTYVKIPPQAYKSARELDCSPFEIISENDHWEVVSEKLHNYHTQESAKKATHYQKQQLKNVAEMLLWSRANIPSKQQQAIINHLRLLKSHPQSTTSLAASVILTMIASGRPLEEVVTGLRVCQLGHSLDDFFVNQNVYVVMDQANSCIALKVNPPELVNVEEEITARQIKHYLRVPDYFEVCNAFNGITSQLSDIKNGISRSAQINIKTSCEALIQDIKNKFRVSESAIWQMLPRSMQHDSGMFTAAAMLTAWKTLNSVVDRHYFTPPAELLQARYCSGMQYLLSDYEQNKYDKLPPQEGFVGAPNCPSDKVIRSLLIRFKKRFTASDLTHFEKHNLATLYTLLLCTVGFGLRHSIDPRFDVARYRANDNKMLLTFVEKGSHRALVLPQVVADQLVVLERITSVTRAVPWLRNKQHFEGHRFFWVNTDNNQNITKDEACQIKPSVIADYLKDFSILFPYPLNSLRRRMFTISFELGFRGPATDFFGGHGVEGRHPFVENSGIDIGLMEDYAEDINKYLLNEGWEVFGSAW